MKLQGIFVDMATPFDHAGRLYPSKVEHNVAKYCRTTVSGLLVGGAAGEGTLLSFEEKRELFALVKRAVTGDRILIAGVDCAGVLESVEMACAARDAGFDLIAAYPPPFGADARALYLRSLADRSPLPVVPMGEDIAHPNVVAAKLCGSDAELLDALKNGAAGGVLPLASAIPYAAIAIWEAFRTREEEAAVDWQERVRTPARIVERLGVAALKTAMDRNGYYGGNPRLPFRPLTTAEKQEVEEAFRDLRG